MDAEKVIESLIRALMFFAGVVGNNWLVIRSLPINASALRTNEILFINLAISNLITNYLVDLPDTMADFAGNWFLGETYCGVFRFSADLSETSSIFSTFFISIFWHQKLVGSLKRGGGPARMDGLRLVACLLAGSWTVAVAFSIPHFFFVKVEGTNESEADCLDYFPDVVAGQTYEIIYLTLANALPLAGIVTISVQIVITLLQNQRRVRSHNAELSENKSKNRSDVKRNDTDAVTQARRPSSETRAPNRQQEVLPRPPQSSVKPGSNIQVRAAKSVVAVASVFLVCWLTHLLLRITTNFHTSSLMLEVASYIAASYTCIIPYIFLHGVKKLTCSCKP
ncbi:rhodopsin [Eucyclogobius newberryi]|uniref:rhodopsin n=1 Tax=Eucyclogobius newberryi TaxID=166745 RepID=UPI003B5AF516